MRIAVGGFQHETNTFAPALATYEEFLAPDAWPGFITGDQLYEGFPQGMNVPVAGAFEALKAAGVDIAPLSWASACPSSFVTEEAFERVTAELVARLSQALPVDGVFLDLHGAMVAEHHQDGEGEILARVRACVGPDVPIVSSLDLHVNLTERMVEKADALVIYRTYPHIDMGETGARAARLLMELIETGARPFKAYRKLDYLTPLVAQCTTMEPSRSIYAEAIALEGAELAQGRVLSASHASGFGLADIHECGGGTLAYGATQAAADEAARRIHDLAVASEAGFSTPIWTPREAVAHAMAQGEAEGPPIVFADAEDNPGAGGNGDTVGVLRAMIEGGGTEMALGYLWDPASAARAHEAGEGAEAEFTLGAFSGGADERPVIARAVVEALSDGRFDAKGGLYAGNRIQMGASALLRIGGVRVVLGSVKMQCAALEFFEHLGLDPRRQRMLAIKSSVHFRADFEPIARAVHVVSSPGPCPTDLASLNFKNLRPGLRVMPRA